MILQGLWRDLGDRFEAARNFVMRTVLWRWASLNEYERKVSSQNGEDGIIEEIFRRIGTTNRRFVEFGVGDGRECNSARLARSGWSGLMLEGDPAKAGRLADRYSDCASVRTEQALVTAENIAWILRSHRVPDEFDLLSIDIDGNDYWVWRALRGFRPRVVVIEYNAAYAPPKRWVMAYDVDHRWDRTTYYGASLTSLELLGAELGYALVATDGAGVNAFFVRRDLVRLACIAELTAKAAYHPPGFLGSSGAVGHVARTGPFEVR